MEAEYEQKPPTEGPFTLDMRGISNMFARLDPLARAEMDFCAVERGILISIYLPENQIKYLVKEEYN